ncbi:hypothetical protein VSDG_02566 [Cytospora chrysosperma]|uniref:Uncharacterized protein n=1 Tax=Cytospora chrysosperma TaxID=252740 RepID=A0A423WFC3_CYTCH|nr:hypothetical protein VSDG_02566 [Valsa sordida]
MPWSQARRLVAVWLPERPRRVHIPEESEDVAFTWVFVSYKDLNCVLAKVDSKGALVE